MIDHVNLGSVPIDEPCAQVGEDGYGIRAIAECRRWRDLLRTRFGQEPLEARLRITSSVHDYGTYHEVVCDYDSSDAKATAYALRLENERPTRWSQE